MGVLLRIFVKVGSIFSSLGDLRLTNGFLVKTICKRFGDSGYFEILTSQYMTQLDILHVIYT